MALDNFVNEDINSALQLLINKTITNLRVATMCVITEVNADGTINAQPIVNENIDALSGIVPLPLPELRNIHTIQGQTFTVGKKAVLLHLDRSIQGVFAPSIEFFIGKEFTNVKLNGEPISSKSYNIGNYSLTFTTSVKQSDISVALNGVELPQNSDGSYSVNVSGEEVLIIKNKQSSEKLNTVLMMTVSGKNRHALTDCIAIAIN